jgi:uncharacterized protein
METMGERDGYEHGVPCLVTTMQPDPEAAAHFYAGLFGWELDPQESYFFGRLRGRVVAAVAPLAPGFDPPPDPAWVTQVYVDSPDDVAQRARAAGGSVIAGPLETPTSRLAVIADPSGAALSAWAPSGTLQGAELVNETGAWSMSQLDTPDVEGAKRFYGEVFGWTNETFTMGDASITMFRLPGYVGGEPGQPVSREVVATMAEAPGAGAGHWTVGFWVADVDTAAARAAESGGRAVAGPFDIGIGRTAVLADPAGVQFSVTKMNGT